MRRDAEHEGQSRRVFGVTEWLLLAVTALLVVVVGLVIYIVQRGNQREAAFIAALTQEQDATRARGDKPVAPDPDKIADDPRFRGATGDRGRDGADGRDGVDGRDGKDGVPGEDGRDGVDGQDGADGADGADGQDGAKGEKGDDAEPAAAYRFQDRFGDWHTCRRDEGSPDSAPTYTCTRDDRPVPVP